MPTPAAARLVGSALLLAVVGVQAEVTADCRNALDTQFRDAPPKLKLATRNLQGLTYYAKTAKTTAYKPAYSGATTQNFPRWLPACSSPYKFVGGNSQLQTVSGSTVKQCLKNPAPTDSTDSQYTLPVQLVFSKLEGSEPDDFACCDQGSQETGELREVSKSPNARHQRRWEFFSLEAMQAACQDNEASSSYGTLYLMSAMAQKTAAGTTYKQAFDDANVICIPQQCAGQQLVELMEERAKECAKNFMDKCWYGLSVVELTSSFKDTGLLSSSSIVTSKDNWLSKVYSEDFGYKIFTTPGFDPESDSRLGGAGTLAKLHAEAYPVIGSS